MTYDEAKKEWERINQRDRFVYAANLHNPETEYIYDPTSIDEFLEIVNLSDEDKVLFKLEFG